MIKQLLYFAYGSNLLEQRLTNRVGKVTVYGTYVLQDYELYITPVGWADIRPKKDSTVEGVLYILTPFQFSILDRYEACYIKEYFTVNDILTGVYTYHPSLSTEFPNRLAAPEYIDCIISGAINFGLEDTAEKMIKYKEALLVRKKKSKRLKAK